MDFDTFKFYVGETVMFCQIIEHDIKVIYAAMLKGDFDDNFEKLEKTTLGQVVSKLKELDYSDDDHFFAPGDYNYLKQMTEKRNHWCHQTYIKFVYIDDFMSSREYKKECDLLQRDHDKLESLYKSVQDIKHKALKKYGRL